MHCNQCEMVSINGLPCHETGCPNMKARWDAEDEEWIKQAKCFDCGCMVDCDHWGRFECNCFDQPEEDDYAGGHRG